MSSLLNIEEFPQTREFWEAVTERFSRGAEQVDLVQGSQIVGTILSRDAAQKAMARKIAEQWLAQPDILDKLEQSLEEEATDW